MKRVFEKDIIFFGQKYNKRFELELLCGDVKERKKKVLDNYA